MTILEMTLSGAVMILAAAVLRALTVRQLPKGTFVALWWLTALRLLIPAKLPSRLSVYTLLEVLRSKAETSAAGNAPPASAVPAVPAAAPVVPSQVVVIPTRPVDIPRPAPEPFPVWTAVWIIGAVLLGAWFLLCYVRWRRRFRESLPADCPGVETCLDSWRNVQLRMTDRINAPLTYGILRPVILLPKTLDLADEEAVTCILAHEMSHVRRLDSLFKLVLAAALCLHWFNPAVWLMYVLANRDMELRCDEEAVLAMGEDGRERYALTLIRLAEMRNECVPLCSFSRRSGMEERIRMIMSMKKNSMLACTAALALVLGITTAFATNARPEEVSKPGEDLRPAVTDQLPANSSGNAADSAPVQTPTPEEKETPPVPDPAPEEEAPAPEAKPAAQPEEDDEYTAFLRLLEKGTPVYAAGAGTVMETGHNAKDGYYVRIQHDQTQESFYANCQSVEVQEGDQVWSGDVVATLKPGTRLRFEFFLNGESTDMMAFTDAERYKARVNIFGASNGPSHSGDYGSFGNPIIAIQDGTVWAAGVKDYGDLGSRGSYVQIRYENGYAVSFYNCEEVLVKTGDSVKAGDIVAYSGKSGRAMGPASPESAESELEAEARWKKWAEENMVNGDFPRNSLGETYGNAFQISYAGYQPDLIAASVPYSDERGYISAEEVSFPDLGIVGDEWYSEEEHNAYDNWVEENQIEGKIIPLYDVEHNVIGEFECGILNGVKKGKTVTLEEVKKAKEQGWPNANGSARIEREPEFASMEEAHEALLNGWPDNP